MGILNIKNVRYHYGQLVVPGSQNNSSSFSPLDMEEIKQHIEDEVAAQMAAHDASVHDTHNMPTDDDNEYPDITIFGDDD